LRLAPLSPFRCRPSNYRRARWSRRADPIGRFGRAAFGNIIGIEVLGISHPEQIAIAKEFAQAHDLAFPRDLAGALVAAK
jgi:hypothetical protein